MRREAHRLAFGAALLLGAVLSGCGEDGKAVPDDGVCPDPLPLYHYEFFDGGDGAGKGAWIPRHADGSRLSADELKIIAASNSPAGGGHRCQTPPGAAKTLDAG